MDIETILKVVFGLISSLGTIALVFFNIGQTRKLKAELLEKFEDALVKERVQEKGTLPFNLAVKVNNQAW